MKVFNRTVDKTKKSNIKCEHCAYWDKGKDYCNKHNALKWYYQRCKQFEWSDK